MSRGDSSIVSTSFRTSSIASYQNGTPESPSKQFHAPRSHSENGRPYKNESLKNHQRAKSFGPDHRRSFNPDDPCVCGPNLYGNVLGPTVDEPILYGLTTFLKMCDQCPERDMHQIKQFDSRSQASSSAQNGPESREQSFLTQGLQSLSYRSVGTDNGSHSLSNSGESSIASGSKDTSTVSRDSSGASGNGNRYFDSVDAGISDEISTTSTISQGTQMGGVSNEQSSVVNADNLQINTEKNLAIDSMKKIGSEGQGSSDSSVPLPKCLAMSSEAASSMRKVVSHHTDTSINGIDEISPRIFSDSTQTDKNETLVNTVEYSQGFENNNPQFSTTKSHFTATSLPAIPHETSHYPSVHKSVESSGHNHEKSSQHQDNISSVHHRSTSQIAREHPDFTSHKMTSYEHPSYFNKADKSHHSTQPMIHSTHKASGTHVSESYERPSHSGSAHKSDHSHKASGTHTSESYEHPTAYKSHHSTQPMYHKASRTRFSDKDVRASFVEGQSSHPVHPRKHDKGSGCSGTISCTCCACNTDQCIVSNALTLSGFTQTEHYSSERFLQNVEPTASLSGSHHKSKYQDIISHKKSHPESGHHTPSHHHSPSLDNRETGSHYSKHKLQHKDSGKIPSQHNRDSHNECRCKTDHTQCNCCSCKDTSSKQHHSSHSMSHHSKKSHHEPSMHQELHSGSSHKNVSHHKSSREFSDQQGSKHKFRHAKSHHETPSHKSIHHHSSHTLPGHHPSQHHQDPSAIHTDAHHSVHNKQSHKGSSIHHLKDKTPGGVTEDKSCRTEDNMMISNCDCCMCREIYNKLLEEHHAKHPHRSPHSLANSSEHQLSQQMQDTHKVTYSEPVYNMKHSHHGQDHAYHQNQPFSHEYQGSTKPNLSKNECLTRQYLIDQGINRAQQQFELNSNRQLKDQGIDSSQKDSNLTNQGINDDGSRMQSCKCNACIDAEIERLQAMKQSDLNCACVINTINKKSIQKCRKRSKHLECECLSASASMLHPNKKNRTCVHSNPNQQASKCFASCIKKPVQDISKCQSGDCTQTPDVRYTITRISKFPNYTTFELMKSTSKKPKICPDQVEGVFVLKNRKCTS